MGESPPDSGCRRLARWALAHPTLASLSEMRPDNCPGDRSRGRTPEAGGAGRGRVVEGLLVGRGDRTAWGPEAAQGGHGTRDTVADRFRGLAHTLRLPCLLARQLSIATSC